MSRHLPWVLAGIIVVVSGVGLLDAVFTDEYDFVVAFALVAACAAALLLLLTIRPPTVELRRDVAHWLTERSQLTGEPVSRLADRAVITYRSALDEDYTVFDAGAGR